MRDVGFSTGAVAKDDFRKGLDLQKPLDVGAVELSALRYEELKPVTDAIEEMQFEFANIKHVSFHAPSFIPDGKEVEVVNRILDKVPDSWLVVVHPDIICDFSLWQKLGARLCIENMDQRKKTGRTLSELKEIFQQLPNAKFCFDIGHCHQVDPTMTESIRLLTEFHDRLALAHISEVNYLSHHIPVTYATFGAFQYVSEFLQETCPLVIESVMYSKERENDELTIAKRIRDEFEKVKRCFSLETAEASQ